MKQIKVTFAPGCFDNFEGTQEELDQLVQEIQETFGNMSPEEVMSQASTIDFESMFDDVDENTVKEVLTSMTQNSKRVLN